MTEPLGSLLPAGDTVCIGLPGDRTAAVGPPLVVGRGEVIRRVEAALEQAGFVASGRRWARFTGGTAERVDVADAATIGLPAAALDRMLGGQPALDEQLWLRALAAPAVGPSIPAQQRAAMHRLAADDSGVWLRAYRIAQQSGRGEQLVTLQDAYESGLPLGVRAHTDGTGWPGVVVALSGLDGAGKSTQAHLLATALHSLGHDVAVEWSRVGYSPVLDRIGAPVKRAAAVVRRRKPAVADQSEPPAEAARAGARRTVSRRPVVDASWAVLVAATESADVRRRQARHRSAGRVVVHDRYLLDAVVHLADRYGGAQATATARAVMQRRVTPAACAFLLELPADVAFARKPGEWDRAHLERHARAYADAADELGVVRLDATAAPLELAAAIGRRVWPRLA